MAIWLNFTPGRKWVSPAGDARRQVLPTARSVRGWEYGIPAPIWLGFYDATADPNLFLTYSDQFGISDAPAFALVAAFQHTDVVTLSSLPSFSASIAHSDTVNVAPVPTLNLVAAMQRSETIACANAPGVQLVAGMSVSFALGVADNRAQNTSIVHSLPVALTVDPTVQPGGLLTTATLLLDMAQAFNTGPPTYNLSADYNLALVMAFGLSLSPFRPLDVVEGPSGNLVPVLTAADQVTLWPVSPSGAPLVGYGPPAPPDPAREKELNEAPSGPIFRLAVKK